MKTIKILAIIEIILLIIICLLIVKSNTTKLIDKYSYTKAICDKNNFCQDYEIVCYNGETKSINPTGAIIQNSNSWKDPRDNKTIETFCE